LIFCFQGSGIFITTRVKRLSAFLDALIIDEKKLYTSLSKAKPRYNVDNLNTASAPYNTRFESSGQ
jgi:hypothetical protein